MSKIATEQRALAGRLVPVTTAVFVAELPPEVLADYL
jgi:hypothetical protein